MLTPPTFSPLGVPLIQAVTPPTGVPTTFATVLCANLHGYDALAETLPPARVVSLLEEYFSLLTDAVLEFGGQIFHLAEADMMAGFGLGDSRHTQILAAVAAARAIQERFTRIRKSWADQLSIDTGIGIGIHRGEFAICVFGSPDEPSLLVVGDTANLAGAMCHRARAGEILVSNAVHGPHEQAVAPRPDGGEFLCLPQVQLRGRSAPLDLWCAPAAERLRMAGTHAIVNPAQTVCLDPPRT
jgi:adenylate cyclase